MDRLQLKSYDDTLGILKNFIELGRLTQGDAVTLSSLFDNERPAYGSGKGLELGGILLSSAEISDIARQQAETIRAEITGKQDIVLFWSKWSAKDYVAELRRHLLSMLPNAIKEIGVNTHWVTEGVVRSLEQPENMPTSDDLVYCVDFLIGSGGTLKYLHDLLSSNQIAVQKTLVVVDKPTINKVFSPSLVDPYVAVQDDYWIFGYGSDCKINGFEFGRQLPFLACLVPEGQGIRNRLLLDLKGL